MTERMDAFLKELSRLDKVRKEVYTKGEHLYLLGGCQVLTHALNSWEVLVALPDEEPTEVKIMTNEQDDWFYLRKENLLEWDEQGIAALLQVREELKKTEPKIHPEGRTYTREGMMKRVLEERKEKPSKLIIKSPFQIIFMGSIY